MTTTGTRLAGGRSGIFRRVVRACAVLACTVLSCTLLASCAVGEPRDFTARANQYCHKTSVQIGPADTSATGTAALGLALARYTSVELLVAEISTDTGLPSGTKGSALRQGWLDPARASLRSGRTDLNRLRTAVEDHDAAAVAPAYAASLTAGTDGVDLAALRAAGLNDCADLFSTAKPAS